jgi:hypothetical protein
MNQRFDLKLRRSVARFAGLGSLGDMIPGLRSSRYIGTRSPGARLCRRSAAGCQKHAGFDLRRSALLSIAPGQLWRQAVVRAMNPPYEEFALLEHTG